MIKSRLTVRGRWLIARHFGDGIIRSFLFCLTPDNMEKWHNYYKNKKIIKENQYD